MPYQAISRSGFKPSYLRINRESINAPWINGMIRDRHTVTTLNNHKDLELSSLGKHLRAYNVKPNWATLTRMLQCFAFYVLGWSFLNPFSSSLMHRAGGIAYENQGRSHTSGVCCFS